MNFYERHSYSDGQVMFNRILLSFVIVIKTILKLIVYSPLIFLGYFITKAILSADGDKLLWIALIIIFAFIFYFIIYFLKGVLIALKHNRNLFWMPLFILCVIVTCVLPVWIVFSPLQNIVAHYAETNNEILTWIFACAFGSYVYSRYHFLTNIAPTSAFLIIKEE